MGPDRGKRAIDLAAFNSISLFCVTPDQSCPASELSFLKRVQRALFWCLQGLVTMRSIVETKMHR